MQAKAIAVAAALGIAALSGSSPPADAATCYRNAVYNDVAGHRTLIREETRCVAGQRSAYRAPRVVHSTTRTVVRDEYVTTSRPYTTSVIRDEYYAVPMTRAWDEEIGYGSSYPEPMRY